MSTDDLITMIKEGSNVPRKGHTQKRDVLADPMYNNKVVTKLINNIMLDGKKRCSTEKLFTVHSPESKKKLVNQHLKFSKRL